MPVNSSIDAVTAPAIRTYALACHKRDVGFSNSFKMVIVVGITCSFLVRWRSSKYDGTADEIAQHTIEFRPFGVPPAIAMCTQHEFPADAAILVPIEHQNTSEGKGLR